MIEVSIPHSYCSCYLINCKIAVMNFFPTFKKTPVIFPSYSLLVWAMFPKYKIKYKSWHSSGMCKKIKKVRITKMIKLLSSISDTYFFWHIKYQPYSHIVLFGDRRTTNKKQEHHMRYQRSSVRGHYFT